MALTWGANGNFVKASAQGDVIRGNQRVRSVVWYATGATAGATLLEVRELSSGAAICADVADSAQLSRPQIVPQGEIEGIEVYDMDAGYVIVLFEEQRSLGVTAKGVHDSTPLVP